LYAKAIHTIQNAMDKRGRSAQTKHDLADLKRAIERNPDMVKEIKDAATLHKIERAGQVPVAQMSTEQLEELAQERARLEHLGRMKADFMDQKRHAAVMTGALKHRLDAKKQRTGLRGRKAHNISWFRKMSNRLTKGAWMYGLSQYRPERFFEFLDGFTRGAFTKTIWEPMKALAMDSSIRRGLKRKENKT
jgi:hypothetical protein